MSEQEVEVVARLLVQHVREINRVVASGMHEGPALTEAARSILSALSSLRGVELGGNSSSSADGAASVASDLTDQGHLANLEKVARAARQGAWSLESIERPVRHGDAWSDIGWSTEFVGYQISTDGAFLVHTASDGLVEAKDAEFIATFDPPTVLRLIALAKAVQS
jgi:hypothetical protein